MEEKVAVMSGRTAIKRMKAREMLVYTYKTKYIHIYFCVIRDGIVGGTGQ